MVKNLFTQNDINQQWWALGKKYGDEEFEVVMGCFDGAEVCFLVRVYILNLLRTFKHKK